MTGQTGRGKKFKGGDYMKKLCIFLTIVLIVMAMAKPAPAQTRSGSVEINGYIGYFKGIEDANFKGLPATTDVPYFGDIYVEEAGFELDTGVLTGFRLGYNFTPYIGVEAAWGWSSANADVFAKTDEIKYEAETDASQFLFNGNLILHLLPDSYIVPFVTAGLGLVRLGGDELKELYELEDASRTRFAPNWGGGVKVFLNENLAVRGDIQFFNFSWGFEEVDRMTTLQTSVGLTYVFDLYLLR